MERIYWTKIKGSNKVFGKNAYVRGRISGFMELLCGKASSPTFLNPENGDAYMSVKCAEDRYNVFQRYVERRYPELCEFDTEFEE